MLPYRLTLNATLQSAWMIVLLSCSSTTFAQEPDTIARPNASVETPITTLPHIDRSIHDAMQSKSYGDAVKLIETAIGQQESGPADYLRYLQGIALTEDERLDEAIETFEKLERDFPNSRWLSRSRFGRANVYVQRRQYIEAGKIYQLEAERLLSQNRKDALAQIYLEYADRYFDGIPADDPSKAKQPDYQQALTYYAEAAKLGTSPGLTQRIKFRIGRCQEELSQVDEAISSYQDFLDQYDADKDSADTPNPDSSAPAELLAEVRYRLGDVHLKAGHQTQARRKWQNFLARWRDQEEIGEQIESFLSRAQYRLAHTYGLPDPASVGDLELAVTSAERFLARYPDHELAPLAELEIAQGYAKHQRHRQAVEKLSSLLDNAGYEGSPQIPIAREMLGQEYFAQGEYDKAIESWKEFLERHPTDPKWPAVQSQIVDTEYAKAKDSRDRKRYDEARSLWLTFLNKYPLDSRASSILLQFGRMKFDAAEEAHAERVANAVRQGKSPQDVERNDLCIKLYEEAIADWRRVVAKYPQSDDASHAAFMIGATLEDKLEQLPEALDSFKSVTGKFEQRARARITRLTTPHLQVSTLRKYRSDETPKIRLTTRNLETVEVKVYRVDMVDYFRKMHLASGLETLDIALIDPDEQFEHAIEGFEPYKQHDRDIELPNPGPGVTAVTVSSDKLESTTMVVVSDLDMIVKASRNELFLFVENMLTQRPAADVNVLLSDGNAVFAEATTNQDGVLQKSFKELQSADDLRVFAIQNGHMAATVNGLQGLPFATGLSPRGYLYTDRPAYRAGQAVNIKGIVRWVDEDRHVFRSDEPFRLEIFDPRGRQLMNQELKLNNFGTIASNLILPTEATQGEYRVQLRRAKSGEDDKIGDLSFDTKFTVTQYQLEPVQILIDVEKDVYFRGEVVRGSVQLQYYYGMPLAGETIQYRFGPDSELTTVQTDQDGKVSIELETQRFNESQPLQLIVEYPDRALQDAKTVYLATRGFAVTVSAMRDVFISGEPIETLFKVTDPAGKPVSTELDVEVFALKPSFNGTIEKLVETKPLQSDNQTGEGRRTITLADGGQYIIRGTGVDQFGNRVSGQVRIQVSGDEDNTRLRILTDRLSYTTGEQASVNLHWREKPALALITMEGARILSHRLVMLQEGDNPMEIPMAVQHAPNVFLNVAVMQQNKFYSAATEFRVSQPLRVAIKPLQEVVAPGGDLTVEVEVTDPNGNPIIAELSLAVVQANLLNAFQDTQGSIGNFFGTEYRRSSVRQASSCTFAYRPETRSVSQFLLAEEDRRALLEREAGARAMLGDEFLGLGEVTPPTVHVQNDSIADFDWNSDGVAMGMNMQMDMGFELNVSGNAAQDDGDRVIRDRMEYLSPQTNRGMQQSQQQRTALLGSVQYRTETRDGKQVQVPYLTPSNSLQIQLPATERLNARDYYQQLSRWGESQPSSSGLASPQSSTIWQKHSINGMTFSGKMVTINVNDQNELTELAREQNLQLISSGGVSETAFWDPVMVTDAEGKATMTVTMPQRSTAWRIRAKGINTETLAGDATADVITKKELFAELKLPLAFTEGDQAEVPVEIHHASDETRRVTAVLKATIGDKSVEQTRQLELKGSGISESAFDVEIESADNVIFELTLVDGDTVVDQTVQTVMIRPYGFPVYETAGGTSSQSTLALIDFDSKIRPERVGLQISIGSSLNRWLVESVLGSDAFMNHRCLGPTATPNERSTSDILGGVAVARMIGESRQDGFPESQSIQSRINSAITQLVSAQNEQGGWSWSATPTGTETDPYLSARVMWSWSVARRAGYAVPQGPFEQGKAYLQSAFASSPQSDLERQAILLHAMSVCGCGDFALANRLYRERNRLNPSALIHLILTMDALQHPEMASDLFDLVEVEDNGHIQVRSGVTNSSPWMRDQVELRAMYLLALQSVRPNDAAISPLAKSLLADRIGSRWPIEKANGPAISGLATWFSKSQNLSEKYRLTVSVNDREVSVVTVDPSVDGSRQIEVPSDILFRDKPQRIEFQLEGRATFSYTAVLSGFVAAEKITATSKTWTVGRRYEPAQRMFDGREVPRGFDVVDGNYRYFTNPLTQLAVGTRAEVTLSPRRHLASGARDETYDYLVLTEPIPAGCTVLDGSVRGSFQRYELEPGQITFFVGNQRYPSDIHYTLLGYVPGNFKTAPSMLRNYFEPSEFTVASTKSLQVLRSGSETVDDYKWTPDELYYLGQKEFEKQQYDAAHAHLSDLYSSWNLDPDKQKNVAQWLFGSSLAKRDHGDTVRYFEILKEKFPDVEISFQDILQVAMSYREIGEYERGYLVYRATIQGSFERESQVAGFLNARGEFVRSVQEMERMHRDYPAESYLATAAYALAQETYRRSATVADDKKLRAQGLTRIHLINAAISMLDHFLTTWPNDPANDEASFALATALIDLEQYESAIIRSEMYASRYPDSRLLDSYWYMIGYSHFELEHPQQALEMCRKVADATFRIPETGGSRPADNRWEAIYIMGQIYHSLGQAAGAIAEYTKVKERFADAAEAINFFTRKSIDLEEISTIRPDAPKQVELKFRNIEEIAVKVYRIDLMKFGLMQRNLDRITAINLAGIRPYHEETVKLGDGKDYRDRTRQLSLPLDEEGAYLMVCRGDNHYTSGLILVSPLTLQIQEDAESGRVRVSVKNTIDDAFISNVHVKVIGSANDDFISGDTDLRGLFIADDIRGTSTVMAAADKGRYAFFRGDTALQGVTQTHDESGMSLPSPSSEAEPNQSGAMNELRRENDALRGNLFNQNGVFQEIQKGNYDELMNNTRSGIKTKEAF